MAQSYPISSSGAFSNLSGTLVNSPDIFIFILLSVTDTIYVMKDLDVNDKIEIKSRHLAERRKK